MSISIKEIRAFLLVASTAVYLIAGCGGDDDSEPTGDTDGDSDGDSDGDTDSDTDGDTDSDTDSDSDNDTDADTDNDSDSDSDTDTDTDTDTDADSDTAGDTDGDVTLEDFCTVACETWPQCPEVFDGDDTESDSGPMPMDECVPWCTVEFEQEMNSTTDPCFEETVVFAICMYDRLPSVNCVQEDAIPLCQDEYLAAAACQAQNPDTDD